MSNLQKEEKDEEGLKVNNSSSRPDWTGKLPIGVSTHCKAYFLKNKCTML